MSRRRLTLSRSLFTSKNLCTRIGHTVATGETWFGKDALERGLCDDEIKTADTCLTEFIGKGGYNVNKIKNSEPQATQLGQLLGAYGKIRGCSSGLVGQAV